MRRLEGKKEYHDTVQLGAEKKNKEFQIPSQLLAMTASLSTDGSENIVNRSLSTSL